jgi:hypothetical protein
MFGQPFSTFTFIWFSKSTCVGFLRNFSSKTSLIVFTKCCKYLNVVLSLILQYSFQVLTTWPYANMCITHVHFWMEFNPTTPHAFIFCTKELSCTNVIHDAKEQCVTHLISMTKNPIVVDKMFCKIISHNLAMADFVLSTYI